MRLKILSHRLQLISPVTPVTFGPGEAFQFDRSEDWAVIAGERMKLQVAHFKLSYSRVFILRAYPIHTLLTHDEGNLLEIDVDDLAGADRTGYADPAPSSAAGSMRYPRRRSNSRYCSETSASW